MVVVGWACPAAMRPPRQLLSRPPSSTGQGETKMKSSQVKIKSSYHHKQDRLKENWFNVAQVKNRDALWETKTRTKTPSPASAPFQAQVQSSLSNSFTSFSHFQMARGVMGSGVLQLVCNLYSLQLLLLTLPRCPSRELLQHGSSPQPAVLPG